MFAVNLKRRSRSFLGLVFVLSVGASRMVAQAIGPPATKPILLRVASGTPIQVALDREIRVKETGQPLHGRVVQPIYVFDHLVIPAGSEVMGQITDIAGPSGKSRFLSILNVDFTPTRQVHVEFDELRLPDGRQIRMRALVSPGSGQVMRMLSAGEKGNQGGVRDAATQKMDEAKQTARQEWQNAMKQIKEPDKMHRLVRYGVAQLPVHPQYLDGGTLYFAELQEPLDFGSESLTREAALTIGSAPPRGSLVHAVLVTPVDSSTTQKGADVEAVLSRPLFDGKRLLFPQGSRMRGSVVRVQPARYWKRNGQLRIAFHELLLPDGTAQRVDAILEGVQSKEGDHTQLDAEGGAKATSSKMRYISTGASVGLALIGSGGRKDVGEAGPVAGGATGFKLVGIAVGLIVRSHSIGIIMSAYGGSRSIYSNFMGRGRDISFAKNTAMEIGF